MTIKGFIFDFDGLILDTEVIHYRSWQQEFERFGFTLPFENWLKTIGTDYSSYNPSQHLADITGGKVNPDTAEVSVLKRCAEILETAPLLPGVEAFIQKAYANSIPMAVASSSSHEWVDGHLQSHGLLPYFQHVICSDDVDKVKPDPALYLKAAEALGLDPANGLAFEDSLNGVKAALAAGLKCYAIPNFVTGHLDLSQADRVCTSFTELDPLELIAQSG